MGTAVAVGATVVGGVLGASAKSKQAKAQRQVIDAEQASRRMQADLQLFSLQQQKMVDGMNDIMTQAAQTQSYMSTKAQLDAQQLMNTLATEQALMGVDVQRTEGQSQQMQAEMQSEKQLSDARLQAGAQALENYAGASGEEQQLVNSVLEQLKSGDANANTIATLLDFAASSGGVNEALQLLSGGEQYGGERASAAVNRVGQMTAEKTKLGDLAAQAGVDVAEVENLLTNAQAAVARAGADYTANTSEQDILTSRAVNNESFQTARVANEAQYGILNASTKVQQQSRYLNNLANEYALQQGQELSQATLDAQRSNAKSPGFFDYAGIALQGYNTYKGLGGR